ncbi:hypothetical protein BFD45_12680 [Escherichia coli]|nr:hypothetical protein BFD45_12680 [Escherichia coli]
MWAAPAFRERLGDFDATRGLSLIRRWRSNDVSLPILVLTARESWQDKPQLIPCGYRVGREVTSL